MRIKILIALSVATTIAIANPMCVFFYGPKKDELGIIYSALQNHAAQPSLTKELSKKALETYVKILDPAKFLLSEAEADSLLNPTPKFLDYVHSTVTDQYGNPIHTRLQDIMAGRLNYFIGLLAKNKSVRDAVIEMIPKIDADRPLKPNDKFPKDGAEAQTAFIRHVAGLAVMNLNAAKAESMQMSNREAMVMAIRLIRSRIQTENYLYSNEFLPALIAKSYITSLDSHSDLLLPKEAYHMQRRMSGEYYGIGVVLMPTIRGQQIKDVIPTGPAAKAGIKAGDIITHVETTAQQRREFDLKYPKNTRASNWVLARNVDISIFATELIGGALDSKLNVKILREGKPLEISIKRGLVSQADTALHLENQNSPRGNLSYLKFDSFYVHSAKHVEAKVKEAIAADSKGLVLDLRGNGGGSVTEMIGILGLFVKPGPAMIIKSSVDSQTLSIDQNSKPIWDKPLVVLIDNTSASASEGLSGALKDYGRAIIVGADESSYGKGSMQQTYPLGNGVAAKLTTHVFSSPAGGHKQLDGVAPDIIISHPKWEGFKYERDLEGALPPLEITKEELPPSYIPNRGSVIEALKASQVTKSVSESELKEAKSKNIDLVKEESFRILANLIGIIQ